MFDRLRRYLPKPMSMPTALTFSGRMPRSDYWQAMLGLNLGMISLAFSITSMMQLDDRQFLPLVGFVAIFILWIFGSTTVRRGHDVGVSAWILVPFAVIWMGACEYATQGVTQDAWYLTMVRTVPFIWLGLMRGDSGTNRFDRSYP